MKKIAFIVAAIFLFTSPAFGASIYTMTKKEKTRLVNKRERAMDRCRQSGQKYKQRAECVKREKIRYNNIIANLEADPESYFAQKQYNMRMQPFRDEIRNEVNRQMSTRAPY